MRDDVTVEDVLVHISVRVAFWMPLAMNEGLPKIDRERGKSRIMELRAVADWIEGEEE